jgi:hypothetical protein
MNTTQNSAPLVSIQIVTWNRRDELFRCLESAFVQTWPNCEVVVVDNASTDGTADMVAQEFPRARLVHSDKNLGCPSGRNLGFAHCHGKYIYMLDDDGWLERDAVELAVRRAESDRSIGVVMSRIHEFADGRIVRRRPDNLDKLVYLPEFSGGCSLIRREVLEKVGAFPEDFFRQAEESDLALRMIDAGYFCCLEPSSVMYHAPSETGRNSRVQIFYSLRNTNRTGLRLWPFPWCAFRPLVNLAYALRFMVSLRYLRLPLEILRDLIDDLRHLPGRRHPVSRKAYALFRKLHRHPSFSRPA